MTDTETVIAATAVTIAAFLIIRLAIDRAARWRHWRVGPWSLLLPGWREQACLRCATSYRYTRPHGTPCVIQGDAGMVFPVCQPCWEELGTPAGRIVYYEELFREWDADPDVRRTAEDLYAIRAAVAAGL